METSRHKHQLDLLIYPLRPWLKCHTEDGYVGGNMFLYFSLAQVRNQDFRGPDVFVVLGVPYRERKSWVVWEEGKGPDIVIELLSDKTAARDKGEKKRIYQDQVRVAEYYWFDPFDPDDWAGFALREGRYEPIVPDEQGRLVSKRLGLALVRWYGLYEDAETTWLRWATLDGDYYPLLRSRWNWNGSGRRLNDNAPKSKLNAPTSKLNAPKSKPNAPTSKLNAPTSKLNALPPRKRKSPGYRHCWPL